MALSNLTELTNALVGWLGDRTDLVDLIPNFIALAEEDMSGRLRARELHERSVAILTEEYEWLPDDFAAIDYLTFGSGAGDRVRVPFRTGPQLDNIVNGTSTADTPCAYTLIGTQIRFLPPPTPFVTPDGVDPDLEPLKCRHFELVYWTKVPALTPDNNTNIVLIKYPSCYLYGSLVAAEPFILNDARLPMWQQQYSAAVERANAGDRADTLGHALQISMPGDAP